MSAATAGLGCDCCRDSDGRPLLRTGNCFLALAKEMQLARKVATYNRAAVTFQRLWRGHACRKQQQVLAKARK